MLQKLQFRAGVNREATTYANEGGWFESEKVRFRSGFPEKIGGWINLAALSAAGAASTFKGVARDMWNWVTLAFSNFNAIGTNQKFYVEAGGQYNDITPVSLSGTLTNPFTTTLNSLLVTVASTAHGLSSGTWVTFTGASVVGGLTLNGSFEVITVIDGNTYTIVSPTAATSSATGGGTVTFSYQIAAGNATYTTGNGWGAGTWPQTLTATLTNPFSCPTYPSDTTTLTVTQTAHGFTNAATFTGSVSGTTLTVTAVSSGTLSVGQSVFGSSNLAACSYIVSQDSGASGLTGTYTLSRSSTVSSTTLYTSNTYVDFQSIASNPCGIDKTVLQKAFPVYVTGVNTYQIQTVIGPIVGTSTYTTYPATNAGGTTTPPDVGGGSVSVSYRTVSATVPDARGWGNAASGIGVGQQLRLWSSDNFGQDLVFAPRQGPIYYWEAPSSTSSFPAAVLLSSRTGASNVPLTTYGVVTSDVQRFVIAMGANAYGTTTFDPMLVRWSDQESSVQWTPSTSNQAGEYRLSGGSLIVGWKLARQEILIWTDSSLYTMQYLGPPYVWGFNLLMDNISIISPNSMASANNVTYWMGTDKFYSYSGRVETLPCSLRQYVFDDLNQEQAFQIQAGTNEGYNEVWWFYPGAGSTVNNKYVIYNHLERVWYYGTINRTTWLDSPLRQYPMGCFSVQNSYLGVALTNSLTNNGKQSVTLLNGYSYPASGTITIGSEDISYVGHDQNDGNTLVNCTRAVNGTSVAAHSQYAAVTYKVPNQVMFHEYGVDDVSLPTAVPIEAYIQSSDFDIGDGHNFGFVWRMLPDVTFDGSNAVAPQITLTVRPRQNSGTQYGSADTPAVTSGNNYSLSRTYNVQQFTGQVYTRIRGRQMAFKVDSTALGVAWQLGTVRIDIRSDGRR